MYNSTNDLLYFLIPKNHGIAHSMKVCPWGERKEKREKRKEEGSRRLVLSL
jgi:hypothetical protein